MTVTDFRNRAYVTGNATVSPLADNVSGGSYTRLLSPIFDLSSYSNPYIDFTRWFRALTAGTDDSLIVSISNGTTQVVLDSDLNASPTNAIWITKSLRLLDYITLSSSMQLSVYVDDRGSDGYVEAVFDKFLIEEGPLGV